MGASPSKPAAADACAPAPPTPPAAPPPARPADDGVDGLVASAPPPAGDRAGGDDVDSDDSDAVARALDRVQLAGSPRADTTPAALAAGLFDGALRPTYRHAAPSDDDEEEEEGEDHEAGDSHFSDDDDRLAALGPSSSRPAGAAAAARAADTASRAARRAGARRERDKADRATVETVLDPRTRLVLFRLLNAGVFAALHGCISTGKEANVYFAVGGPAAPHAALAVKVYKTSILAFKDRHRYVTGDYRYERGYGGGGNARRMVRVWAEKEARNLARIAAAGVPCPTVVTLRSHVLAMTFIGDPASGDAAPRLKDARLSRRRARDAHRDVLLSTRAMYARARLVHADLSEYNLLYHGGRAVVIDVSQAVDLDHPRAFDFLRRDAATVAAFFGRRGVVTLPPRVAFDFVTDPRPLTREQEEAALDAALAAAEAAAEAATDAATALPADDAAADAVFMAAHIPRRLADVADHERDAARLAAGGAAAEGIFYQALAGMADDMTRVRQEEDEEEDGGGDDEDESDGTTSSDDSDGSSSAASSASRRGPRRSHKAARACTLPPDEAAAARAERRAAKAVAKEAARERRKTKTPKHVKKRAVAKGKKKR